MRKASVNRTGTNITSMLLAYAYDINVIDRGLRDITATFSSIEKQSAKVGLMINENKTKLFAINKNNNVSLEIIYE